MRGQPVLSGWDASFRDRWRADLPGSSVERVSHNLEQNTDLPDTHIVKPNGSLRADGRIPLVRLRPVPDEEGRCAGPFLVTGPVPVTGPENQH